MPTSFWPAVCRRKRKGSPAARGARHPHAEGVDPPGNARRDSEIICDLARRLGRGQYFPFKNPAEIFEELRVASRGGIADYYGITYERVDRAEGHFLAVPHARSSRHAAPVRGQEVLHPDGKAHFKVTEWRESGDPVDDEYPFYPDHRPRSQPVSVRHADPPYRRTGRSESGASG